MTRTLDQLRAAQGGPAWREAVISSSATLTRGVSALLASLNAPASESHIRAQRFARVTVAKMQLYQAAQVQAGLATGNIYGALKAHIDEARAAFSGQFRKPGGIPDYLHEEMVRELAHHDPALLGPQYPGPMA
jgi:hypothetical protein